MDSLSLDEYVLKKRQSFSQAIGKSLTEKKRISDLRLVFISRCHKKFPGLAIPWTVKNIGMAKSLLTNYKAERLLLLIDKYLESPAYHTSGVSFLSFYTNIAALDLELITAEKKATAIAERKAKVEAQDEKELDKELATFKNSPFFKRLGKTFQEKL